MAEENENSGTGDVVATETPIEAPAPKKQRAPRRSKAEIAAASVAKSPEVSRKSAAKAEAAPAAETPAAKATAKGRAKNASSAVAPAATPVAASDEMADLVQLEEENKQLRMDLAEKLRAQNADLRKRLGA